MKTRINKYKAGIIALALVVAGTGCKKQLDINQDPNFPSVDQSTPQITFPAGLLGTLGGQASDYQILGGIWAQYFTQSSVSAQYKYIDGYNVQSSDFNTSYANSFSRAINSYQLTVDKATLNADWSYYLMAQTMKAYSTSFLVDLYDQIPYTEALQGAKNLQPKFDDGYTIYQALIDSINQGLSKDLSLISVSTSATPGFSASDLVFAGDLDKWTAFANTMKLKLYLRMVNKHADVAQAGIKAMYDEGVQFLTSDASITNFTDAPGLDNPMFDFNIRSLNTTTNIKASRTFTTWLTGNADPRAVSYFGAASPIGINQGDYAGTDPTYNNAAVFVQKYNDPAYFISAAESYFMQAEVAVRYGLGDAKSLYDAGVTAAFAAVGLDASSFINAGGKYEWGKEMEGGVALTPLEQIIRQKWASLAYGAHQLEAFFEKNRTGFPKTSAVYSTNASYIPGQLVVSASSSLSPGQFPKRLVFPDNERQRNNNTPSISDNPITKPVWWSL
ncbi:SusD/RagB family nutrient-binding outer membrane lipoprotein [Chitinophagaceae bacterium 26-R-25]|nr:SusD/RagB family nutrient-binding outer membrane lipoprotein [Chitinophagaceae bacterium 26-R-25]